MMKEENCTIEGLYKSFRSRLKAFVSAKTRDEALADDFVQDTFVKLTIYCAQGGSCRYPKSLLFRVAENMVTDHFRARARSGESLKANYGNEPEPEQNDLGKEYLECFLPLIDQLPEPYREAVILADIQQMPQQEVAVRLGISLPGAKARVQRGRAKLRAMLTRICDIEHDRLGNILRCDRRRI